MNIHNNVIISLFAVIILAAGYHLSAIHFMGQEWLSRAGSLVVVLGIVSGFSGIIQERILTSKLRIQKRIAVIQKKRRLRLMNADPALVEKELEDIETSFLNQTSELLQMIKFSVGLIEGVLLILGTIIWGFGDLIIRLVVS
ncbi:MAG: hypothetical protein ACSHW0_08015 [Thalassotalea sp.]